MFCFKLIHFSYRRFGSLNYAFHCLNLDIQRLVRTRVKYSFERLNCPFCLFRYSMYECYVRGKLISLSL